MSKRSTLVLWIIVGAMIMSIGLILAALGWGRFDGAAVVGDVERQRAFVQQEGFLVSSGRSATNDYVKAIELLGGADLTRETLVKLRQGEMTISIGTREIVLKAAESVVQGATRRECDLPIGKASLSERLVLGSSFDGPLKVGSKDVPKEGFGLCAYACLLVGDMRIADGHDAEGMHFYKATLAMGLHLGTSDDHMLRAYGIAAKQTALESILDVAKASDDAELASQVAAMSAHVRKEFEELKKEGI